MRQQWRRTRTGLYRNCREAIRLKADYAEAYNQLGIVLNEQGQSAEAIENYRQAVRFKPDFAEAYNHLGVLLNFQGCPAEATENHRRALQLDPDYAEAHLNLSFALLRTGRLTEGWKEYEWRRKINDVLIPPNAKLLFITYSTSRLRPSPRM